MILNDKKIKEWCESTVPLIDGAVFRKVQKGGDIEFSYGIDPQGYTFRLAPMEGFEDMANYLIMPGQSFTFESFEIFDLPEHICAFLYGKSSFTRYGLIYSFAVVDAGYRGTISFSVFNPTKEDIKVNVGQGIAQIVFHEIDKPQQRYQGQYGV